MNALRQFHRDERDEALPGRREEIRALAAEGYVVRAMDGDFSAAFHYQINSRLDIWPSRNRFAFLGDLEARNSRGNIHGPQTITEFVHERLPLK